VRGWLLPVWERMLAQPDSLPDNQQLKLVQTLESALDGVDADWLARIESAQQRNPRDARLTYLAGAACVERQLWGKAQVLLAQAAQRLQDVPLRRNAWRALALLAERRDDATAAAEAWKNAALAS
jgi:HemY protein